MLICKCKLVYNLTKLNVLCWLGAHGIYHTIDLHMTRGQRGGEGGCGVHLAKILLLTPFSIFVLFCLHIHHPSHSHFRTRPPPIGVNCFGNAKTKLVSKIPNSSTKLL